MEINCYEDLNVTVNYKNETDGEFIREIYNDDSESNIILKIGCFNYSQIIKLINADANKRKKARKNSATAKPKNIIPSPSLQIIGYNDDDKYADIDDNIDSDTN